MGVLKNFVSAKKINPVDLGKRKFLKFAGLAVLTAPVLLSGEKTRASEQNSGHEQKGNSQEQGLNEKKKPEPEKNNEKNTRRIEKDTGEEAIPFLAGIGILVAVVTVALATGIDYFKGKGEM